MSNLPLSVPESVLKTLAFNDLGHMLRNVETIEKLKVLLKLIDRAIEKYTLDGEMIAVYEYETIKMYVLQHIDNCERGGLIFMNRIGGGYGYRPGHVGFTVSTENNSNETTNKITDKIGKIEKLQSEMSERTDSIERLQSKINEKLTKIEYKLDH